MDVIFLDIAGVLLAGRFRPEAIARLNRITACTGAKIVISSDMAKQWDPDKDPLPKAKSRLIDEGVKGDIIACTYQDERAGPLTRASEIETWLDENPEVGRYVILDDLPLHDMDDLHGSRQPEYSLSLPALNHFVRVHGGLLSDKDADLAIGILGGGVKRLTEGEHAPAEVTTFHRCWVCGGENDDICAFRMWEECDDQDEPSGRYLIACREDACQQVIENHPRLYRLIPWAGDDAGRFMLVCEDCDYRKGFDCTHPNLTRNGGEGLNVTVTRPLGEGFICVEDPDNVDDMTGMGTKCIPNPTIATACEGNS